MRHTKALHMLALQTRPSDLGVSAEEPGDSQCEGGLGSGKVAGNTHLSLPSPQTTWALPADSWVASKSHLPVPGCSGSPPAHDTDSPVFAKTPDTPVLNVVPLPSAHHFVPPR